MLQDCDVELLFDLARLDEAVVVAGAGRIGEDEHAVAKHAPALVQRFLFGKCIAYNQFALRNNDTVLLANAHY